MNERELRDCNESLLKENENMRQRVNGLEGEIEKYQTVETEIELVLQRENECRKQLREVAEAAKELQEVLASISKAEGGE
jgi:predicted RNase H-like nuclease (RuvC/YqgF family)